MRPVNKVMMEPIGIFRTSEQNIPRHWTISDVTGDIIIRSKFKDGMKDIAAGRKIVVLFHFHESPPFKKENLIQHPKHRDKEMGVFSICSPLRPNPIGFSVLNVLKIKENIITVTNADMIDGTPILDIKPYIEVPQGDH